MAVNKLDPKIIFASEAPAQDVPAVFTNKTVGWGESRKNGGRPTIKQSNALQQETDLKILWLNENAVTPYDASIDYPTNAVTIKDGAFKIFNGSVWNIFLTKSSVGLGNVDNTSDLNKPISTATQSALNGKASIGNTYDPTLSYNENERVILLNGDTVQSTISNNTNNPNTNMTGWVLANSDVQIKTWSGRTQEQRNKDQINLSDYKNSTNTHTQALQNAINTNPRRCIHVNAGTYDLTSVNIPHSISFMCEQGVVFKRGDNLDTRQSAWDDGTAMFEIKVQDIAVMFFGGMTFDGNNQNQIGRYQEPTGQSIKIQPPDNPVSSKQPVYLYLQNPKFINGTHTYLTLRGDNFNRRYITKVVLDNPIFTDTIMGTGKGDPQALTALGYSPTYIAVYDYVQLISHNTDMRFNKITQTGEYSPVGILGTYYGKDYSQSGESSIFLTGKTYIERLGRENKSYSNDNVFTENNGIGAIDMYGNGDHLYVENIEAVNTTNVAVRAKASVKNYTVNTAFLKNCWRGLQVSPSSTGLCETVVNIGSLHAIDGVVPQLEINGTSPTDMIPHVSIGSVVLDGTFTNSENYTASSIGNVFIRNSKKVSLTGLNIESSPVAGIRCLDIEDLTLNSPTITSEYIAYILWGCENITLVNPTGKSLTSSAFSITDSTKLTNSIKFFGGKVLGAVGNGVLIPAAAKTVAVFNSVSLKNITGLSRGFSFGNNVNVEVKINSCEVDGVTTPITAGSAKVSENSNSWNPSVRYGVLYLTTVGKSKKGDIVYSTNPSAGSNIGWVCVVGDSTDAGTWKPFGNIAT